MDFNYQTRFQGCNHRRLPPWKLRPLLLILFWVSLALALAVGRPVTALTFPSAGEIRGVWLTTNDTDILIDRPKLHDAIATLAQLNFNTVYPVVWNSGYALFPSGTAQRAGIQTFVQRGLQNYDPLAELVTQAHQQGLLVIPWFEFGFMAPSTSELALNHPDWLTQQRNGQQTWENGAGEVVWMNPFKPEVQQFLTYLVLELLSRYPIDGVQFDDHFSLPVEFGYDDYTVGLYKQETDKDAPADPHNPDWVSWRANRLSQFVQQLNAAVKARKPSAVFSISPNPYDFAYTGHLQDWLTWVRQGWVDELIVQVYRQDLQAFREQISRPEIQETRQLIPTGIGILTGLRNSPISLSTIQSQVYSARSFGLGVSFFFYESLWDEAPESVAERQSGFQTLFAERMTRVALRP